VDGVSEPILAESVLAEPTSPVPSASAELTERDRGILSFERRGFRSVGAKEEAIRIEFALSAARYYQLLAVLIDSPPALADDPLLIKRLHRMRDVRSAARAGRSLDLHD